MKNNDWAEIQLSDILDIKHGYAFSGEGICDTATNNVLVTPGNFSIGGGFKSDKYKYFEGEVSEEYVLQEDDLIVTMTDLSKQGDTLGYSALIPQQIGIRFLHNQRIGKVKIKDDSIANKKFIAYLLRSPSYRHEVLASATGSTVKHTSPVRILAFKTSIPPLAEQKAIAQILGAFDDKIELNRKMNETLEIIAQTLFKSWFVEKNAINQKLFGDLVHPKKGKNITKADAKEGKVPVVAGGIEPSCYHNIPNTKSPVVTVSASGANAGFVNLYHVPVWSSDSSFIDNSITPYVYFSYIFLKLNQEALFEKQEGSAQPHIYPRHVMNLAMPSIPEKLLEKYENTVSSWFEKIRVNMQQNETLTSVRDDLLPKLVSGQLRIKDAEKFLESRI